MIKMNKEIEDALHTLLHCSLKDTEYETQVEQFEFIYKYIENLEEEIRKLKKQLEQYENELEKADSITQRCIFNGKKESEISFRKCLNMLEKLKNQQKEFINFLTEAINKLKLKQKTSNSAILKANIDLQVEVYSIVLSKYKEIIGDDK